MAIAFVPNPDNKPQINHIDGDMQNNHHTNLEWVTNKENSEHAQRLGLMRVAKPPNYKHQFVVQRKKVIHTGTGEIYDSVAELAAKIGWKLGDLRRRIGGERPNNTPYQYTGEYSREIVKREWIPRKCR